MLPANTSKETDEELAAFLVNAERGYPAPDNLLEDVNVFNYHPRDLPGGMLFLIKSTDLMSNEHGFWFERRSPSMRIRTILPIVEKTTMEFYELQTPNGERTEWLMHVYKIDNGEQNSSCLCKVEQDLDLLLSAIARVEESNPPSQGSTNDYQMTKDRNASTSSPCFVSNMPSQPRPGHLVHGHRSAEDYISTGDYLELDDLDDRDFLELNDLGSSSSSWSPEDSSAVTVNSEDFRDSDVSLQDVDSSSHPNWRERNCKYMVSATRGPNLVIMDHLTAGFQDKIRDDTKSKEAQVPNPQKDKGRKPALPATSSVAPRVQCKTTRKHAAEESQPQASSSNSTNGERRAVSITTKIWKKFCCFA